MGGVGGGKLGGGVYMVWVLGWEVKRSGMISKSGRGCGRVSGRVSGM